MIEKVVARRRFDAARSNPPTSFPKGKNKKHFLRVKSLPKSMNFFLIAMTYPVFSEKLRILCFSVIIFGGTLS